MLGIISKMSTLGNTELRYAELQNISAFQDIPNSVTWITPFVLCFGL